MEVLRAVDKREWRSSPAREMQSSDIKASGQLVQCFVCK